jgi:hypothetical protein
MNNIKPVEEKALEFREELIKLCNKYKCEISGSNFDNGDIDLLIYDKSNNTYKQYIMQDYDNKYNLYEEDLDNCCMTSVMSKVILESFNRESREMAGLNNVKVYCGIFTNDASKAENKLQELIKQNTNNVKRVRLLKDYKDVILNDDKRYIWIKANTNSRGYRCKNAIIDRSVTFEELFEIIQPICIYCGRDNIEVF